jgi:hypothetical protein
MSKPARRTIAIPIAQAFSGFALRIVSGIAGDTVGDHRFRWASSHGLAVAEEVMSGLAPSSASNRWSRRVSRRVTSSEAGARKPAE